MCEVRRDGDKVVLVVGGKEITLSEQEVATLLHSVMDVLGTEYLTRGAGAGALLKARRKELKITRQSLAETAKVSISLVQSIENHNVVPSATKAISLCKALGVSTYEIWAGDARARDAEVDYWY